MNIFNRTQQQWLKFLIILITFTNSISCLNFSLSSDTRGARFWTNFEFVQTNTIYGLNMADYVFQNEAAEYGLASLGQESPFALQISVDNSTINPPFRKTVKLQSVSKFGDGLYVLDINHFPSDCGVWPSFYSYTGNESNFQEIDIIQNVNDLKHGPIVSIHTNDQCQTISQPDLMTGTFGSQLNCKQVNQNVSGCVGYYGNLENLPNPVHGRTSNLDPQKRKQNDEIASNLGQNGESIIVMQRDLQSSQTISFWSFNNNTVPKNLNKTLSIVGEGNGEQNNSIKISTDHWPKPNLLFSLPSYECMENWLQHYLVIDIGLCGQWGIKSYNISGCAKQYQSCENQVANQPLSFNNAFWSINSITVFSGNNFTPPPDPLIYQNDGINNRYHLSEDSLAMIIFLCISSFFLYSFV